MKKILLAGISIVAVVVLLASSQSSVVGYQVVKTSQENLVKKTLAQRELLIGYFKEVIQKAVGILKINSKILYWIGFLFGILTLVPAYIFLSICCAIFWYLELFQYGTQPKTIMDVIFCILLGLMMALTIMPIYPDAWGKWFVEKFGGSLNTFLETFHQNHHKASIGAME